MSAPATPDRRPAWALALVVAALAALAWHNRFIQDDAFISFRYAANLAHGHGLVWNPGEPVEGYTNFLWTLLMAGAIALGLAPVPASFALGLACFALTLVAAYRLGRIVLGSSWLAVAAVALLGTNYTFSAYATGGLETQMQACLLTWATVLALGPRRSDASAEPLGAGPGAAQRAAGPGTARLAGLSLLCGLALLTRLDSALFVAVLWPIAVVGAWRARAAGARTSALLAATLPALLLVVPWLAWKLAYYGDLLPNPFYVKVATSASVVRGLYYLGLFLVSYLLVHVPVLVGLAFARRPTSWREPAGVLLVLVVLWCLYVAFVGGDFMEFRFLVPVLPLAFVLTAWLFFRRVRPAWLSAAFALAVVAGSAHHALTFQGQHHGIEAVRMLAGHLEPGHGRWIPIGERLKQVLGGDSSRVTIATTAAGAIPYYSGLRTVDMLGLSDRWIARHGPVLGSRPGHQRLASVDYLLERGVNLVIGHPQVVRLDAGLPDETTGDLARRFMLPAQDASRLPAGTCLVALPLDERTRLVMLYLAPDARIESAIRGGELAEWAPFAGPGTTAPSSR